MITRRAARLGRPAAAAAALVAVHLALTAALLVPGHLSVDEGTYHMMAAALVRGDGLSVDNGYPELRSEELRAASLVIRDGRLVALPPPMHTVLAAPWYLAFGYPGLIWLSSLSFAGTALLVAWLARRLFPARRLGGPAAAVFALAGFAWPYAIASWPHATATLAVTAAFALALARGRWSPALAGLVLGIGIGVRLDVAFAFPAVLVAALSRGPRRVVATVGVVAGALPPLALLALANRFKFGDPTPFSYGGVGTGATRGIAAYLPLAATGALALAAAAGLVALWRRAGRREGGRSPAVRAGVALAVVALAGAAAAVPLLRELGVRLAEGAVQLVVDLRLRPLDLTEPALARSPGGAMVYAGGIKKSLLQSCPWIVACVLPLLAARRGRGPVEAPGDGALEERWAAALAAFVPLLYVGIYSYFGWHGGLAINLRYLLPALPFLAVLGAVAWDRLNADRPPRVRRALLGGGKLAALAAAALWLAPATPAVEELALLSTPLALAALLAALTVAAAVALRLGTDARLVRAAAALALAAGWAWSALVTFGYDLPWERSLRGANLAVFRQVEPYVPERSLLFVAYPDPFFGFVDRPDVVLAVPARDSFADFRRLAREAMARGRPVIAAFRPPEWELLRVHGLLEGLEVEPLWTDRRWYVARLRAAAGAVDGATAPVAPAPASPLSPPEADSPLPAPASPGTPP